MSQHKGAKGPAYRAAGKKIVPEHNFRDFNPLDMFWRPHSFQRKVLPRMIGKGKVYRGGDEQL